MSTFEELKHLVYNYNVFTDTQTYMGVFYILAFLFFIISYAGQIILDKPCYTVASVLIRTFHHFIIFFIYFGALAPANILYIVWVISFLSVCLWITFGNKCILTLIENSICGYPKNRVYRDILYYLSRSVDKYVSSIRIMLVFIMTIFISIRWYVYYRTNRVVIQGHRGARGNRPENTISAFDFALENGIYTLEMDLHMSKDGEIVIFHDDIITEPICSSLGVGVGGGGLNRKIKEMTLPEISQYSCGGLKNPDFPQQVLVNEHIPTLLELILHIQNKYPFLGVKINVEIKTSEDDSDEYRTLVSQKVVDILEKTGMIHKTIVQSISVHCLNSVKRMNPSITTSYIIEKEENINGSLEVCLKNGFEIVSPYYPLINNTFVAEFKNHGLQVIPWTVNDTITLKMMMDYGVKEIITDYPVLMKEYLSVS